MPKVTKQVAEKQVKRGPRRGAKTGLITAPASNALATESGGIAQVRLRRDELARLQHSMHILQISSTSDALREALRLLEREANEEEAAAEIRAFYRNQPAPLPDGVVPIDEAEMAAADELDE